MEGLGPLSDALVPSQSSPGSEEHREGHSRERSRWAQRPQAEKGPPALGGDVVLGCDWSTVMEMTPESPPGAGPRRGWQLRSLDTVQAVGTVDGTQAVGRS